MTTTLNKDMLIEGNVLVSEDGAAIRVHRITLTSTGLKSVTTNLEHAIPAEQREIKTPQDSDFHSGTVAA